MDILSLFNNFPPELATFIISMLPVLELRGAIPVAIGVYNLDPIQTYFLLVLTECHKITNQRFDFIFF